MTLISPIIGSNPYAPPPKPAPQEQSSQPTENTQQAESSQDVSEPSGSREASASGSASAPGRSVDQDDGRAAAAASARPVVPTAPREGEGKADAIGSDRAYARTAAERQLREARTRLLIDQLSPIASGSQGKTSYAANLLMSG
ncbi:hypothetical protein [Brevirhabdus sp.]|uniref:hypothetical protein n=1 Tax=Brevirhabdus sp. TaxID=2004514 RepID=UPI0040588873